MSGMAEVLTAHGLAIDYAEYFACTCGTIQLTANGTHGEHAAAALTAAGFGPVAEAKAEAFDQGQKSGIRHATRLAAAVRLGRPDLPGPISPNPYRAAAVRGEG